MELYLCSLYIPSSPGQGQIYVLPFVGTRGAGTVGNFRVFCLSDLSVEVSIYAKRPVSGLDAGFLIFPCLQYNALLVARCLLCSLPDVAVVLFSPRTVNTFVQLCRKSKFHDSSRVFTSTVDVSCLPLLQQYT